MSQTIQSAVCARSGSCVKLSRRLYVKLTYSLSRSILRARMKKTEEKKARATVRLPADLYREARILALERGVTFQMLVEALLSKELEKSETRRSERSNRPRKADNS